MMKYLILLVAVVFMFAFSQADAACLSDCFHPVTSLVAAKPVRSVLINRVEARQERVAARASCSGVERASCYGRAPRSSCSGAKSCSGG